MTEYSVPPVRYRRITLSGLDVSRIRAKPYGPWKYLLVNGITHLWHDGDEFMHCMQPLPRYYEDITSKTDEITCIMCCQNVCKPVMRVH